MSDESNDGMRLKRSTGERYVAKRVSGGAVVSPQREASGPQRVSATVDAVGVTVTIDGAGEADTERFGLDDWTVIAPPGTTTDEIDRLLVELLNARAADSLSPVPTGEGTGA